MMGGSNGTENCADDRRICRRDPALYAFYNRREEFWAENIPAMLDGSHIAFLEPSGRLAGYFSFGEDGRIPTVEECVYDASALDIGLGLRPDLCGQGNGLAFVKEGIHYAEKMLGGKRLRLSVAAFNERAIRVYQRAGFQIERQVTNAYFKNLFYIMVREP